MREASSSDPVCLRATTGATKRCKVTPVATIKAARPIYTFTAVKIVCGGLARVGDLSHVNDTINLFLDQITTQSYARERYYVWSGALVGRFGCQ